MEIGGGKLNALVGYSQEENTVTDLRGFRDGHLTNGVMVLNAGLPKPTSRWWRNWI